MMDRTFDWHNVIPNGFVWNELELERDDQLNVTKCLLSLLVVKDNLQLELIGTAFTLQGNDNYAFAVTAAHNFEHARNILHPDPLHHPSALAEFLPSAAEMDLTQVKCLYHDDNYSTLCDVELAAWDRDTDCALLVVKAPVFHSIFNLGFSLDDQIPLVGDPVVMMGIGEMEFTRNDDPVEFGKIKRRLVARVGRVESVCPEGNFMIKAPCVQTSIPVFPGMSGGVVTRWTAPKTPIQAFGLISHSPSADTYYDRSVSGSSIRAILTTKAETIAGGRRQFRITMKNAGIGRSDLHPGRRTRQEHGGTSMEKSRELEPNIMLQQALLCDDVRIEGSGKSILIGVYNQLMTLSDLPASILVCLWTRFKINKNGIYVIEAKVTGEREINSLSRL